MSGKPQLYKAASDLHKVAIAPLLIPATVSAAISAPIIGYRIWRQRKLAEQKRKEDETARKASAETPPVPTAGTSPGTPEAGAPSVPQLGGQPGTPTAPTTSPTMKTPVSNSRAGEEPSFNEKALGIGRGYIPWNKRRKGFEDFASKPRYKLDSVPPELLHV